MSEIDAATQIFLNSFAKENQKAQQQIDNDRLKKLKQIAKKELINNLRDLLDDKNNYIDERYIYRYQIYKYLNI